MKNLILIPMLLLLINTGVAQSNNMNKVQSTINSFANATEKQSTEELNLILDPGFRVVMNRLFGSKEVAVLGKEAYLKKIQSKEWGGEKREVSVENLTINGSTATAKVIFKGSKLTFVSLLQFVESADGSWKIISDMPTVI